MGLMSTYEEIIVYTTQTLRDVSTPEVLLLWKEQSRFIEIQAKSSIFVRPNDFGPWMNIFLIGQYHDRTTLCVPKTLIISTRSLESGIRARDWWLLLTIWRCGELITRLAL